MEEAIIEISINFIKERLYMVKEVPIEIWLLVGIFEYIFFALFHKHSTKLKNDIINDSKARIEQLERNTCSGQREINAKTDEQKIKSPILDHSQITPKFEIKVDKKTTISTIVNCVEDELVENAPILNLNISLLPNKPMILSKLFLKIEDETISPTINSVYNKSLHLPFNINQKDNYDIQFILPRQFDDKNIIGKIIAIADGIEWESDKFAI